MRDSKAGFMMSDALFGTLLLTAIASAYLSIQTTSLIVNFSMIPICLVAMVLTYLKGAKIGAIWTLCAFAALALLSLIFWPAQLSAFIFWLIWTPVTLFVITRLRTGINGVFAERDFYRGECARIAMVDSITQMRSMHAYLNDAPIYIKIAKRYNLNMVVMVMKLVNNDELRGRLEEVAYNEMLEAISKIMRGSVRLEDLAYFINNETGVWCLNMFTHLESIDVVVSRVKTGLKQVKPDYGVSEPCPPVFAHGYAIYHADEDPTPITLLERAIAMAEKDSSGN